MNVLLGLLTMMACLMVQGMLILNGIMVLLVVGTTTAILMRIIQDLMKKRLVGKRSPVAG